jgi:hypothetical protein
MTAVLPKIPIRALKLGDRISLTGVARTPFKGLRCGRSFSVMVPPVRFGRVSEPGAFLKVFFGTWAIAAGARVFHGGGAPKDPYTRPQARR